MLLHHAFQGNGFATTSANVLQGGFGQIYVLKLLDMGHDGFAGIVGLGAPGALGQPVEPLFDDLRKPNSKHGDTPL
jgi:hypothetical protein